jgi:hypothetical protein
MCFIIDERPDRVLGNFGIGLDPTAARDEDGSGRFGGAGDYPRA